MGGGRGRGGGGGGGVLLRFGMDFFMGQAMCWNIYTEM